MVITRSGTALDEITGDNIVEVGIRDTSSLDMIASSKPWYTGDLQEDFCPCNNSCTLPLFGGGISACRSWQCNCSVDSEGQYFLGDIPVGRRNRKLRLAKTLQIRFPGTGEL